MPHTTVIFCCPTFDFSIWPWTATLSNQCAWFRHTGNFRVTSLFDIFITADTFTPTCNKNRMWLNNYWKSGTHWIIQLIVRNRAHTGDSISPTAFDFSIWARATAFCNQRAIIAVFWIAHLLFGFVATQVIAIACDREGKRSTEMKSPSESSEHKSLFHLPSLPRLSTQLTSPSGHGHPPSEINAHDSAAQPQALVFE